MPKGPGTATPPLRKAPAVIRFKAGGRRARRRAVPPGPQNRFHSLRGPGTNDPPISASGNRVCARGEENVLLETPGAPLALSRTKRKLIQEGKHTRVRHLKRSAWKKVLGGGDAESGNRETRILGKRSFRPPFPAAPVIKIPAFPIFTTPDL